MMPSGSQRGAHGPGDPLDAQDERRETCGLVVQQVARRECLWITRVWPRAWGKTSMKARTCRPRRPGRGHLAAQDLGEDVVVVVGPVEAHGCGPDVSRHRPSDGCANDGRKRRDLSPPDITERQKKWFASVQASLERDTGKTLDQWVAIAQHLPGDQARARARLAAEHHGLGVNRAATCCPRPSPPRWAGTSRTSSGRAVDRPGVARRSWRRWRRPWPASRAWSSAQRKGFTAWSRKVQFAAIAGKGGKAWLAWR